MPPHGSLICFALKILDFVSCVLFHAGQESYVLPISFGLLSGSTLDWLGEHNCWGLTSCFISLIIWIMAFRDDANSVRLCSLAEMIVPLLIWTILSVLWVCTSVPETFLIQQCPNSACQEMIMESSANPPQICLDQHNYIEHSWLKNTLLWTHCTGGV